MFNGVSSTRTTTFCCQHFLGICYGMVIDVNVLLFSLQIADLCDNHVSLYQLTLERGTRLHKLVEQGTISTPDGDTLADMYLAAVEVVKRSSEIIHISKIIHYISKIILNKKNQLNYKNKKNCKRINVLAHNSESEHIGNIFLFVIYESFMFT